MKRIRKAKIQITTRGIRRFFEALKRSRKGTVGIVVLAFYGFVAFLAPFIAPHDPVRDTYISGTYAAPRWVYQLLGQEYSENLFPVSDPQLNDISSKNQWIFCYPPEIANFITFNWTNSIGNPGGFGGGVAGFPKHEKTGCIFISLNATNLNHQKPIEVNLTKQFSYPFSKHPDRFVFKIATLVEGAEDVPVTLTTSIKAPSGTYCLWSRKFEETSSSWLMKSSDSNESPYFRRLREDIFSQKGNYTIIVNITFEPKTTGEATLYLDDFELKCYGNCYGLLGTDHLGRDLYSQLIWGTTISFIVGMLSAILSVGIGLIVGLFSGYIGGILDELVMRFTDMLLVIPGLPLLLVIIAVLGPSIWNLILLLGLLGWMGFARNVRSTVLSLKERPFIEAARASGGSTNYIIIRHIVPNVMNLVYVSLALSVPSAILSEAALSFLGLYDPLIMTWGKMLHFAQRQPGGVQRWWWVLPPGLCIATLSLSFILLGYALDEILNPRLRIRR